MLSLPEKAVVAAASLSGLSIADSISFSLFNVPSTVLGMAAGGAMLSFAYAPDGEKLTRRKLYGLAAANTIFATAAVAVLPAWLGWVWVDPKMQPPLALLLAASARFFIPALIKLPAELIKKWFKLGEYNETKDTK